MKTLLKIYNSISEFLFGKKSVMPWVLLLTITTASAQIRFADKEYHTFSIAIDPAGSIKEGGLDIVAEIEHVAKWGYVKANVQSFTALEGNYTDLCGGVGLNLTTGYFDQVRVYSGIRLGHIWRGVHGYPLFGLEGGTDYNFSKFFIGVQFTYDYRSDMKFSGAKEDWQANGKVRIGFKF
jgi:hypothetical protein